MNFNEIREEMARLELGDSTDSSSEILREDILVPQSHVNALDPGRTLVVGNRGMGKSFWTRALVSEELRPAYERVLRQPSGLEWRYETGFDDKAELWLKAAWAAAPDPELLWRARLLEKLDTTGEANFEQWVRVARDAMMLQRALDEHDARGRGLVLVFDALDRLGQDWRQIQARTLGLLKLALLVRSWRSVRLKLFMRTDQFHDPELFSFPDASKLKHERVELGWSSNDLYELLFNRLRNSAAFRALKEKKGGDQENIVAALAGPFMGTNPRRGRVYTWVPKHLADARDEISPRTFVTAWGAAARHGPPLDSKAVDHHGLYQGVRKASEVRLDELREDYGWVKKALDGLKGASVPMLPGELFACWKRANTLEAMIGQARNAPVRFDDRQPSPEQLLEALIAVGVVEERSNGKVNVPDIFRVEARIKRRGGVAPPKHRAQ